MSIARLSAGSGYQYLMRHTARGDAPYRTGDAMTRYYTNPGYPAGIWLGCGLPGLAGGGITAGMTITEEQMARLFGAAHDPVTDAVLGREYATAPTASERIAVAVAALPLTLSPDAREARITAITAAEKARPARASVAGFDLTFSVPKSVSVLWALSDADVQRAIVDAHHAAVAVTIGLIETDVARTRTGRNGAAHVPVRGLIAAGFDHHDSRAGDPQLHTHVTVANRAQATCDDRWRTLDSRGLFAAAVAHSDTYDALLADEITRRLGLTWEMRTRGRTRNPRRELAAIPDHLIGEFSQRSAAITAAKDAAIADFVAAHRRQPTGPEAVRIRQQATLQTRRPKHASTLAEYADRWARRAGLVLGTDPRAWARRVVETRAAAPKPQMTKSPAVGAAEVEVLAAAVLDQVEAKRATWTRWNLMAATCRTMGAAGMQFETPADLIAVRRRVTQAAIDRSVLLNPTTTSASEVTLDVATGRSIFDPPEIFTSPEVLAAEDALLDATDTATAPTVDAGLVETIVSALLPGRGLLLDSDQADAVRRICTSGRICDVLVGPAGTGKTTTMAGLRAAWEAAYGPGSVIGLATSAVAADVLSTEIDVAAENTAQWLAQQRLQPARAQRIRQLHTIRDRLASQGRPTDRIDAAVATAVARHDRWSLHPGQLLVLDEAGMADAHTLDALATQASASGAKLLLVGDHRQLPAIGAGGTFELLAEHRADTPQLVRIRRFTNPDGSTREWEAQASLDLRRGDPAALDAYQSHGRFADGTTEQMIETAYAAWKTDLANGLNSLLVAADSATVQALNLKARADRIETGQVQAAGVTLRDETIAGVGDRIIARRVDRHLPDGTAPTARPDERGRYATGFVKNGTAFTVTAVRRDGSLRARADGAAADVTLPAGYVADHVELGYAVTAHRCQGMTVHTTHTIATSRMTREAFYVALTRGTQSNRAYIALDTVRSETDCTTGTPDPANRAATLAAILKHEAAETSAHKLIRDTALSRAARYSDRAQMTAHVGRQR